MNIKQYEKSAIVALRVIGSSFTVMGLVWCSYALAFLWPGGFKTVLASFLPGLLYMIIGILLFLLSKPLAALTVRGLKDE